jgi:nucleoside-diphosphate-sugar epimerase
MLRPTLSAHPSDDVTMTLPLPLEDLDFALERTEDLWSRYAGARLVITGGTGFIGRWLVELALRANEVFGSGVSVGIVTRNAVRSTSRLPHIFSRPDAHVIEIELDEPTDHRPFGGMDLCIHAATEVPAPAFGRGVVADYDSIVLGTRRTLEAAHANGATRFLLTSTGSIYGAVLHGTANVAETYNGAPGLLNSGFPYGNAKRAAEWFTSASATPGFATTIARIFTPIGPGLPLDGPFAAGNFVRDAIARQPIVIQGDVRTLRSYLYTADLAVWLMRILVDGKPGEAYNVGSEHPVTIGQLAETVAQLTNGTVQAIGDSSGNENHVQRYIPNTHKARHELNLEQYHSLEDAVIKTITWTRRQYRPV